MAPRRRRLRDGTPDARVGHDATAALHAIDSFRPGVALLELGLPELDGHEIAARVQTKQEHVQFVAVTADGQSGDKQRASRARFAANLVKP